MKFSNIVLRVALASSFVCANAFASGAFIGVDATYSQSKLGNHDFDANSKTHKVKLDGISDWRPEFGIKAGYDFDNFRVYGEYLHSLKSSKKGTLGLGDNKYPNSKIDWHRDILVAGADYTPGFGDGFSGLIGAYTGLSFYKITSYGSNATTHLELRESGADWLLGGKLGGIVALDEHNELEFGYKLDYTVPTKTLTHGVFAGYNFKF